MYFTVGFTRISIYSAVQRFYCLQCQCDQAPSKCKDFVLYEIKNLWSLESLTVGFHSITIATKIH